LAKRDQNCGAMDWVQSGIIEIGGEANELQFAQFDVTALKMR